MDNILEEQKLASIIKYTKKIEVLLKENGATGKGIHSQVTSIENKLSPSLTKDLRWIATMRNKSIHENFIIEDIESFERTSKRVIKKINNLTKKKEKQINNTPKKQKNNYIIYILIVIAITFFYFYSGESKEEIQKKVKDIELKIEKINNSINDKKNKITNKKNTLEIEVKNQGILHSIFKDTEKVNRLETEIENLEDDVSELTEKKEELEEEKKDLIEEIND